MDSKADNFRKGKGVRYQIDCWNGLLEGRIKLQKALSLCNQLPQYHTAKSYISTDCCSEAHSTCEVALTELLDELFGLQRAISDKRTDINSFFSVALRNEVLEKWSQKLQLASGRLTMRTYQYQNHSIVSAIEHILKDKPRLIRRTQLKRSSFKIIGNVDNQFPKTSRESPRNSHLKEVDSEIFDDGDFYHQLIKDQIHSIWLCSDFSIDTIALSRKWLQIQSQQKKIRKDIDTKASKGRKLRYQVQQKLIGFMAPVDKEMSFSDNARTKLFGSLFC